MTNLSYMLELDEILAIFNEGKTLTMDEEAAETCNYFSQEAQKITCRLNYEYHDPDEIREMFSELIGKEVSDDLRVSSLSLRILEKTSTWEKMFLSTPAADSRTREEFILEITFYQLNAVRLVIVTRLNQSLSQKVL